MVCEDVICRKMCSRCVKQKKRGPHACHSAFCVCVLNSHVSSMWRLLVLEKCPTEIKRPTPVPERVSCMRVCFSYFFYVAFPSILFFIILILETNRGGRLGRTPWEDTSGRTPWEDTLGGHFGRTPWEDTSGGHLGRTPWEDTSGGHLGRTPREEAGPSSL